MKTIFISLLSLLLLPACGGSAARSKRPAQTSPAAVQVQPKTYTYRIAATYPHSTAAYTQGLYYDDGLLWEGTGQYGESLVQTVDLTTGKTSVLTRLPRSEFGEGIARVGDEGQLFGSVTASMIADAIKEQLGIEADHKRIDLKPIKTVGAHAVQVSMYRDIAATVTVEVNDAAGFAAIDAANAGLGAVLRLLYLADQPVTAGTISEKLHVSTARVAVLLKNGPGECVRQAAPQVVKQAVRQLSEADRTAAGIQMTSEDVFFWEPAVVKMPEVAP